jgi:hypothetical protein
VENQSIQSVMKKVGSDSGEAEHSRADMAMPQ